MENKKKILYFCSADHALTHAVILSMAPLLPTIEKEFGFSHSVSFSFAALSIFIYGTGGIPAGHLSDRIGPLKTLLAGIALVVLASFALALSSGPEMFVLFIFLLGLGSSFYHPPGLTAISNSFDKDRGKALGTHGLLGNVGQFTSPFIAGVIGALFGWRANYLVWAFAFIGLGLVLLYLMKQEADKELLEHIREAEAEKGDVKGPEERKFFMSRETWNLVTTPMVLLILVLTIFRGWFYRGLLNILPFYLEDIYSLSGDSADALKGTMVTLALITGGIGNYLGGHLKDKHGSVKPLILFTLISVGSTLLIIFNPFTLFESSVELMGESYEPRVDAFAIGVLLFGFGFFGGQSPLNAIIADQVPAQKRGRLFGISFFTRFGLSSLAMVMVGVTADRYSVYAALSLNLAFILLALGTILFLDRFARAKGIQA